MMKHFVLFEFLLCQNVVVLRVKHYQLSGYNSSLVILTKFNQQSEAQQTNRIKDMSEKIKF